jgi:hypothetical protein
VELGDIWDTVVREADNYADDDGVHVFAFFRSWDDRGTYESSLLLRHRLVWLTPDDQREMEQGRFAARINELLAFEEAWQTRVRPADVRDALILPDRAFQARPPLSHLWKRSARVTSAGNETLEEIEAQRRAFREMYYRLAGDLRGRWLDEGRRVFEVPNPRDWHAHTVPASQRWKFSWRIPHGFHYDVTRERGGAFTVQDETGIPKQYATHVNIDPLNFHRR